jgi:NADPH:quinone reductase
VLGAGGSAGQPALQSARVLGAGLIVGAARGKDSSQAADLGADAAVDLADEQAIDAGLAAAAPGGYDVFVDFLWDGVDVTPTRLQAAGAHGTSPSARARR